MKKIYEDWNPQSYNFKTAAYEAVNLTTLPAERLREFMPQGDIVQRIFECNLHLEETPVKAYLKTMEALAKSFQKQQE